MSFFVGLWPIISHFSLGLIVAGVCVAVALLTAEFQAIPIIGTLLAPLASEIRKWAIVAAVGSGVGLIGYSMGVKNESDRCRAQFAAAQKAAVKTGVTARTRAQRDDAGGMCDPRDTDCKH